MSTPPGTTVTSGIKPATRSVPTFTGPAHIAILTDRAPAAAKKLTSMDDWPGTRQTYSVSYDWGDGFFRNGGNELNVAAIVGPAAAAASLNVPGTSGTGIVLTARDKGEFGNGAAGGYSAVVTNGTSGGSFRKITISFDGEEIGSVDDYQTNQAAVDALNALFGTDGDIIPSIGGGTGLTPTMTSTNFTGGTIDRLNITTTHLATALAKHHSTRGPGQEAAPDFQSDDAHEKIRASAVNHGRFAVLDTIDTTSKATMIASADALFDETGSDRAALYAPWITVPALAAGGSDRAIPPSAAVCARMAVNDASPGDGPAQSPMGDWGIIPYATGVNAEFSRDTISGTNDAGDLNDAGVNLIIVDNGAITIYGMRTLVDQDGANGLFGQVGTSRYRMSLEARGNAILKRYVGRKITRQRSIEPLEVDLEGLLLADYQNGDLFGDLDDDRPQTAFRVDTDTPNTTESIAQGRLKARLYYRPVKGGEFVELDLEAVDITDSVG